MYRFLTIALLGAASMQLQNHAAFAQTVKGELKIASGKCLDIHLPDMNANGGRIQIWNCNGGPNQEWAFDPQGRLINSGGKCLDVHSPDLGMNGARTQTWDCNTQANQAWSLNARGEMRVAGSDQCLDVHGPEFAIDGGRVQTWTCNGAANQSWSFVPKAAVPEPQAIRNYLDSLPPLRTVQPVSGTLSPIPNLPEGVTGQQKTGGRFVNQQAELAMLKTFTDIVWPGALVQGHSISNNDFAPLILPRSPGRIRLATDFVSGPNGMQPQNVTQFQDIASMRSANVDDARRAMLAAVNANDSTGNSAFEVENAGSIQEAMVKLGFAYKAGTGGVSANASVNSKITENTVFVKYIQTFYTVGFEPDSSYTNPFFADSVTLNDVRRFTSATNPPLYVSEVKYGRILLLQFTAESKSTELKADVEAIVGSIKGTLDASLSEKLNGMRVKVLSVGNTGELNAAVLTQVVGTADIPNALKQYIERGAKYHGQANPGAPIAFTMRYIGSVTPNLGPYAVAISQMVTDESPELYLEAAEFCRPYQVWRGQPGGGWRETDLAIGPLDTVRFVANGATKNWRVFGPQVVGPNGWLQPIPGVLDYGFPLGNRPPHSLIARFGGRDRMGRDVTGGSSSYNASSGNEPSDSFFVGTGTQITAGKDPYFNTGRLYFGINDSEAADLGDPNFKVNVTACVTRKVY